ncbi:MAG: RNA polymerase sigma factor [Brevinematales bacterium]|nr:RNA polymerase sigma factor [Brevinematales bacterium]
MTRFNYVLRYYYFPLPYQYMDTEAELIYRIICGDEESFNELYNKYSKLLIKFVYRYTRDVDMSVDVVQETFVKLLENIKRYSPRGSFKSFLFKTAINIIRDRKRKEKRDRKMFEEITQSFSYNDDSESMKEQIMDIIDSLPDRDKEMIIFRLEGYKIEEIAEFEGCSVRTVKRVLKRVISEIKSKISGG